jgi:hypothetical protein
MGIRKVKAPDFLDVRHYEDGKVITLTHRPSLPPVVFLVLIFTGWIDPRAYGSVGSFEKKSLATPLGIDSETLQLVAQCLNHYATPDPKKQRILTPWSRVLPEKLKRPELLKKFPAFYGTRRFITAFTRARHLSICWARLIQSPPPIQPLARPF